MSTTNTLTEQVSIDLSPLQLKDVKALLAKYLPNTPVWAYGSRVRWSARPNSDLDIVAFASPAQAEQVSLLREAFEESNLPFTVDFFVWDTVPEKFRDNIQREYIELQSDEAEDRVMGSEWPLVTLQEIAAKTPNAMSTGPFGSAISSKFFVEKGVPVIRGSNLSADTGVRLLEEKMVFITEEKAKEFSRSEVKKGDLIFTCWGTINQVGLLDGTATWDRFIISNKQMKLSVNTDLIDSRFIYYLFSSPLKQQEILANGIGAAVPGFNLGQLKTHAFRMPPKYVQETISDYLDSFHKKIQLNHQTNQTLEKMAQALFKSWFVDFDPVIDNALAAGKPIPDELQDHAEGRQQQLAKPDHKPLPDDIRQLFPSEFELTEELGWVPMGWKVKQIKDFGDIVCGKTPSKKDPNNFGGNIPFIKIPDTHGKVYPIRTVDTLTMLGASSQPKKEIPAGSICVSSIATVGKVVITPYAAHTNQQINTVVPFSFDLTPYIFFYMLELKDVFHDLASGGSATLNMNTSVFSKTKLLMPSENVLVEFYSKVKGSFAKILSLEESNVSLEKLINTLLPKLISGELRLPSGAIPDTKQQAATAVT